MLITGELLQSFADVTISNQKKINVHKNVKNFVKKIIYIKLNEDFSDENINEIKKHKVIFIYSDFIEYFFKKIISYIDHKFILITHNCDLGADIKYKKFIDNNNLVKWYSNNIYFNHEKLIPLPIGIANSQWKHGNLKLLNEIIKNNNQKTKLLYTNFSLNTNKNRRNIKNIIENNFGSIYLKKTNQKEYLNELSKHKFCVSPPGNGIDCHRTWEALYLGVIPIVKSHPHNLFFQDLPILIINDWKIITPEYLNKIYQEFQNKKFNMQFLNLEYWKTQFQNNI